jgi:signal peptide peptidase SppA
MAHHIDRALAYALNHPWAITRPMLSTIASILARRVAHVHPLADADPTFVRRESVPQPSSEAGGVLVIPIHGVIAPRMDLFSDVSGGATFEGATKALREGVAARDVATIVLDFDSPGGSTAGATEFAAEVRRARDVKPVIAHANFQMCSAAYWVGACATEVIASPSAMVGSIGVYTIHEDYSVALEQLGIKVTYIAEGEHKVEGNETEPLSDHAAARLKALVVGMMDAFAGDVAEGRHVAAAHVRSAYGKGDVFNAAEALAAGMVDRIETLDATLTRLTTPAARSPLAAEAHGRHLAANAHAAALYALAL